MNKSNFLLNFSPETENLYCREYRVFKKITDNSYLIVKARGQLKNADKLTGKGG